MISLSVCDMKPKCRCAGVSSSVAFISSMPEGRPASAGSTSQPEHAQTCVLIGPSMTSSPNAAAAQVAVGMSTTAHRADLRALNMNFTAANKLNAVLLFYQLLGSRTKSNMAEMHPHAILHLTRTRDA